MEAFPVLLKPEVIQRVRNKSSKVPCSIHLNATPENTLFKIDFIRYIKYTGKTVKGTGQMNDPET